MRKLFSLLSLAIMFFMVGCETSDVPTKSSMSFTFTNVEVETTFFEVIVTPSDPEMAYYLAVVEASEIKDMDDTAIINNVISGDIQATVNKGTKSVNETGLAPETQYTILAFADGDTVEVIDNGGGSYTITYRVTVNDKKLTATYNGGLQ